MATAVGAAPSPSAVAALAGLGSVAREAGFSADGLRQQLGVDGALDQLPIDAPLLRRRLRDSPAALRTLVDLFALGRPIPDDEAVRALGGVDIEALVEAGLLLPACGDGAVRAAVAITPTLGLLLAHDRDDAAPLPADHVGGVGPAARTLAALTPRRPVERALDVGTGCGVQALLAAAHATHVVATDVSGRALSLAGANAILNGVDNVEWRSGDMFEPVAGERYDLVVVNPPFVLSPDEELLFRDSGGVDGSVSREAVTGAAAHLAPGGIGIALCSWPCDADDWRAAPLSWVDATGCDAWVLVHSVEAPLEYAATWNGTLRRSSPARYEATLDRWTQAFAAAGIERLATGAVVLRRPRARGGPSGGWARVDHMPHAPSGAGGEQLVRAFENRDRLRSSGEAELFAAAYATAGGHRYHQVLRHADGETAAERSELLLDDGVGVPVPVPPAASHLLLSLDGATPLGELVSEIAASTGLDERELRRVAVDAVRRWLELGAIVPVPG